MAVKSICHDCEKCWIIGNKFYCNTTDKTIQYSKNKKQCKSYEKGMNYKKFRHNKNTKK